MAKYTGRYIQFSFPISAYHPDALQSGYTEKELRREYSRLRDIAQKRLTRMGKTEWVQSQTYKYNVGHYPKLKDVGSKTELGWLLNDMARFLSSSAGSITGLEQERQRTLETLHANEKFDFSFVTKSNWWQWLEFIEWAKDFAGFVYETNKSINLFVEATKAGKSVNQIKQNFEQYLKEIEETGRVSPDE